MNALIEAARQGGVGSPTLFLTFLFAARRASCSVLGKESVLALRTPAFDAPLEAQCLGSALHGHAAHEVHRQTSAGVPRTAAGIVLIDATLWIKSHAGVQRAICAFNQIDEPGPFPVAHGVSIIVHTSQVLNRKQQGRRGATQR